MPKMKTKQSVAKRVRITKSGRIKMKQANRRHILTSKTTKSKRQTRSSNYVHPADEARIHRCLPYGQS